MKSFDDLLESWDKVIRENAGRLDDHRRNLRYGLGNDSTGYFMQRPHGRLYRART